MNIKIGADRRSRSRPSIICSFTIHFHSLSIILPLIWFWNNRAEPGSVRLMSGEKEIILKLKGA